MRLNRVFVDQPLATGGEVPLPEAAAYHVARVLRLRAGAPLVLFDGSGADFRGEIVAVEGDRVHVRVGDRSTGLRESPLAITLVQAVSRGERMDWTLQKATELGVRRIQPVLSARSVVRLDDRQAARKLRHWQAIVAGACEQCGRSVLPEVRAPLELARFLAESGFGVTMFLLIYVVLILLLGTVIDSSSILLIVLPLMLPVAEQFGLNLVWFGVITVVAVEIGLLTPPFGLSVYVVKSTLGDTLAISLGDIFLGTAPFTLTMMAVLVLLLAFPQLSLVLLR